MNPMMIATMRPRPILSRSTSADSRATASGTTCMTAVMLAIGMCMSAMMKRMVAIRSSVVRSRT